MSETGPLPETTTCHNCDAAIAWLWSPRVNQGLGGWVMFTRASEDGMTITSHRCSAPRGPFSYTEGESAP